MSVKHLRDNFTLAQVSSRGRPDDLDGLPRVMRETCSNDPPHEINSRTKQVLLQVPLAVY